MMLLNCIIAAFSFIGAYAVGENISDRVRRYLENEKLRKAVKSELKKFCYREHLRRKGEKLVHNACVWSDELRTLFR